MAQKLCYPISQGNSLPGMRLWKPGCDLKTGVKETLTTSYGRDHAGVKRDHGSPHALEYFVYLWYLLKIFWCYRVCFKVCPFMQPCHSMCLAELSSSCCFASAEINCPDHQRTRLQESCSPYDDYVLRPKQWSNWAAFQILNQCCDKCSLTMTSGRAIIWNALYRDHSTLFLLPWLIWYNYMVQSLLQSKCFIYATFFFGIFSYSAVDQLWVLFSLHNTKCPPVSRTKLFHTWAR